MTRKSITELCVPRGQYCYTLSQRKGETEVFVGPYGDQMAGNDVAPVVWDPDKHKLVGSMLQLALRPAVVVPAGHYAVVQDPCRVDGKLSWPEAGKKSSGDVELQHGTRAYVEGPVQLVPWPGQTIEVLELLQLRADEYVVLRDARTYERMIQRGPAVVRPSDDYAIVEIDGQQVHRAARLSPTQWCCTVQDDGEVQYHYGHETSLVFPRPNESFCRIDFAGKTDVIHDAVRLDDCGVAVVATRDHDDVLAGERLFIQDGTYYWPNQNHQFVSISRRHVVPFGERHYEVAHDGAVRILDGGVSTIPDPWRHEIRRHADVPSGIYQVPHDVVVRFRRPDGQEKIVEGPEDVALSYHDVVVEVDDVSKNISVQHGNMTRDGVIVDFEVAIRYSVQRGLWFRDVSPSIQNIVTDTVDQFLAEHEIADLTDDVQTFAKLRDSLSAALVVPDVTIDRLTIDQFEILTDGIADSIHNHRVRTVNQRLSLLAAEQQFADEQKIRAIEEQKVAAEAARLREEAEIKAQQQEDDKARELRAVEIEASIERTRLEALIANEDLRTQHAGIVAKRSGDEHALQHQHRRHAIELEQQRIDGQADAQVKILEAVTPELTAALELHGKAVMFKDVIKNLGPAALVKEVPIMEFAQRLLAGSALEGVVAEKPNGSKTATP